MPSVDQLTLHSGQLGLLFSVGRKINSEDSLQYLNKLSVNIKGKCVYSSSWETYLRATRQDVTCHVGSQCYLPPDTSECLNASQ